MKKKYREQALGGLLAEVASKDFDTRENALFQLGLVLERSYQSKGDMAAAYEENLDRQLLRLRLSDAEQIEVVDSVTRLIATEKSSRATGFWTLGKAKPATMLAPLMSLMCTLGKQLDTEARYQAALALFTALSDETVYNTFRDQLEVNDPSDLIDEWTQADDKRLQAQAEKLAERIEQVLK